MLLVLLQEVGLQVQDHVDNPRVLKKKPNYAMQPNKTMQYYLEMDIYPVLMFLEELLLLVGSLGRDQMLVRSYQRLFLVVALWYLQIKKYQLVLMEFE